MLLGKFISVRNSNHTKYACHPYVFILREIPVKVNCNIFDIYISGNFIDKVEAKKLQDLVNKMVMHEDSEDSDTEKSRKSKLRPVPLLYSTPVKEKVIIASCDDDHNETIDLSRIERYNRSIEEKEKVAGKKNTYFHSLIH